MYLSILGKPTDQDLERYPAVHLTGPHEWDPSVLDYTHPSGDGEPPWSTDPDERYAFDPNFDEFGDYTQRAIQTLSFLDDSSSTFVEFWGLPPLILFFNTSTGWFGRFALSTECYRTRKLGYKDLNWPRCSARVTESLALTDGGFCQKQTLYILDYVKLVSL